MVFEIYTQQGLSINAIARLLNERQIRDTDGTTRWERSTVWGMLRNPAYRGPGMLWQNRAAATAASHATAAATERPCQSRRWWS